MLFVVDEKIVAAAELSENKSCESVVTTGEVTTDETVSGKCSKEEKIGKESESVNGQTVTIEESLIEVTSKKTESDTRECVDDNILLEKSLIELASKKTEVLEESHVIEVFEHALTKTKENVPSESVGDEVVPHESLTEIEPTSTKAVDDQIVDGESLIGHTFKKSETNTISSNVGENSSDDVHVMAIPVESLESALESLSLGPTVNTLPAEPVERPVVIAKTPSLALGRPRRERKPLAYIKDYYCSPLNKTKKK